MTRSPSDFPMAWLCLSALVILGTASLLACDSDGKSSQTQASPTQLDERADPAQFRDGTLNSEAVRTATEFKSFPVLWLGEEFNGYKLTSAGNVFGGDLALVYGACERAPRTTSCTPPLVIINRGPNFPGGGGREPFVRGLTTGGPGLGSTTLWTAGGLAIEVQSNTDIRDEIVQALVLANGNLFGLPEVPPGESLDPLNEMNGQGDVKCPSPPLHATVLRPSHSRLDLLHASSIATRVSRADCSSGVLTRNRSHSLPTFKSANRPSGSSWKCRKPADLR